jgi:hypothetical protein
MKENLIGSVCGTPGRVRNAHSILVAKPKGRDHSEDLGADKKIILEWILGK